MNARLVDRATGAQLWAERYEREISDIFLVQDEIVRSIVSLLVVHMTKAEIEQAANRPPSDRAAYDYFLKGSGRLSTFQST